MEDIPTLMSPLATRVGDELAGRIASDFFGSRQTALRRVVGKGSVNQVFVAKCGGERVVVRLCDDPWAAKQYEKEVWCIQRAAALGVPGPNVYALGTKEGAAYMIQSFVHGEAGNELPASSALRIWRKLGEYAKTIHGIKTEGFGIDLPDLTGGNAQRGWLRYIDYNIESLGESDELVRLGVLTAHESTKVRLMFEELRALEFRFGLSHGDISLKNTIVDDTGRVFLFDWGSAAADIVPHLDLIQIRKIQLLENDPDDAGMGAFLDGYGMSRREYETLLPELETMLVLRAFDVTRWAIDRCTERIQFYASGARRALARKLAHA